MHLPSSETGFACIGREPRQVEHAACIHYSYRQTCACARRAWLEGRKRRKGKREISGKRRLRPKDAMHQARARARCTQIHVRTLRHATSLRRDISTGLSSRTKKHDERKIEIVTEYERDVSTSNMDDAGIFQVLIEIRSFSSSSRYTF